MQNHHRVSGWIHWAHDRAVESSDVKAVTSPEDCKELKCSNNNHRTARSWQSYTNKYTLFPKQQNRWTLRIFKELAHKKEKKKKWKTPSSIPCYTWWVRKCHLSTWRSLPPEANSRNPEILETCWMSERTWACRGEGLFWSAPAEERQFLPWSTNAGRN